MGLKDEITIASQNNEEGRSDETSSLSVEEVRAIAKERAKKAWEEYLNSEKKPMLGGFKSGETYQYPCNCYYQVLDLGLTYPRENYTKVDLNFGTPLAECVPGNPWECDYFEALYNSFYPDCVDIFNEDCVDVWPYLPPPSSLYPFDCEVDRNSSFLVSFSAIALAPDNCVSWAYFPSGYITFKIYCEEATKECAPEGTIYESESITLSIADIENEDNTVFTLAGECGCTPFPLTPPGGSGSSF